MTRERILWQKIVTREYTFLYATYTIDAYKRMEDLVGTTLQHNLFYGEGSLLSIYRENKDVLRSYKMIEKIAKKDPSAIVEKMDRYDYLVSENYRLFKAIKKSKNKQDTVKLLKLLDKIFLETVAHFIFFVFLGYAADRPAISAFLKKYGKRFEKIRMYTIDVDMNAEFPKVFSVYDKKLLTLARYMTRRELLAYINGHKSNMTVINNRMKKYLLIVKNLRVREYSFQNIAKILKKELSHIKFNIDAKSIKGNIACRGQAKGRAVVVLTKNDYKKIKKGNILVTSMTKPSIVPHLKRVSGIITNDGGALCHASIISREMNIPCIVGTVYATDILKDGDLVEVDASKGIVRKLK